MIVKKFPGMSNLYWVNAPPVDMASTDIREKLKKGEGCVNELGAKVSAYIKQNGLYK